jgi:putative acetyltransferase
LHDRNAPWPTNPPTPPRGTYLIAYADQQPMGMGALRPIDKVVTEIRRMYVLQSHRRTGVARLLLLALEREASELGFRIMRLETGYRQGPAMRLYESYGFTQIPPFGQYSTDPTSVCYEKAISV